MEKNNTATGSSPLASPAAVVLWLVLGALCLVFNFRVLGGAFVFLFLLCGAAVLWGRRAMKGVSLEGRCDKRQLFPGEETDIQYTIANDKLLPLVWLEMYQDAPAKNCLTPDESFEPCELLDTQQEAAEPIPAYRRSFAFVMGYETLTLTSRWTARRRGVYKPEKLHLRSGDGFGLTQLERQSAPEKLPELVVYPRAVDVDVSLFLHSYKQQPSSAMGLTEDVSVLRGLRPYQTTDSWKRINWRMAARQPGELNVNFFETVQPVQVLFVLDGESFYAAGDEQPLETALETLASVIRELFTRGIGCGLCLPVSRRFPPVTLAPGEERSAAELLYYLAGYECLAQQLRDKEGHLTGQIRPSVFDLAGVAAAASGAGIVAVITQNPDDLSPDMLRRLGDDPMIFSAGSVQSRDEEKHLLPLQRLRRGGGSA